MERIEVLSLLLFVGLFGCSKKPAEKPAKRSDAAAPSAVPISIYSQEHSFRIQLPEGTSAQPDGDGTGSFTIKAPTGEVLIGKLTVEEQKKDHIAAAPFQVTYKAATKSGFTISGIQGGDVFFEKAWTHGKTKLLLMRYPASAKAVFDPQVARIAKSFEEYLIYTGPVGMITPNEADDGGALWFGQKEGEAVNDHTICHFSEADSAKFNALKEGQTVTVGGTPEYVTLRGPSEQFAGLYETNIRNCVLTATQR